MSSQFWPEISICLSEVEKEKYALTKKAINLDAISAVRDNINRIIDQMRVSFEQVIDKQYASQVLFAVVAYFDEQIQSHLLEKGQANWVPLQKDFYGAYNAGVLFYDTIDKLVEDKQVPEIVYEVFYFILKKGFLGKYRDSKTHINKYMEILKEKISVEVPQQMVKDTSMAMYQNKLKIKPRHYYTAAGAVSVLILGILYVTSSL
ncbi:MAG TPA: DotU family type IV/VI secretion system protein [Rhabdochlamydiaceae bacterium]